MDYKLQPQDVRAPCEVCCQYESEPNLNDPGCGLCMEPNRKGRCVPFNYVQKVCAIVPNNFYEPSPYRLDDATTYKMNFIPKIHEKVVNYRPDKTYRRAGGLFHSLSEYNYTYVPYQVTPYKKPSWAKLGEFQGVEGTLNGVTTYKADYQKACGSPAKMFRPRPYKEPNPGSMEDITSYRLDFVPHGPQKQCPSKPIQNYDGTGDIPFNGTTTYTASYQPLCYQFTQSAKPPRRHRKLDYGFEKETTYSGSYRPFAFQDCRPPPGEDCFKALKIKF